MLPISDSLSILPHALAEPFTNLSGGIPMKKKTDKQLVWSVEWDSGGPGGGDDEEVYLKGGKYFYIDSSGGGRYRSSELGKLLRKTGLNQVNTATVSISSPVLSSEEIVAMLETWKAEGHGVLINDEQWVCLDTGVLVREGEEPPTQSESTKSSKDEELTPQQLEDTARRLIREGRMPSFKQLAEVLNAVAEKLAKGKDSSDRADDS